MQPKTIKIPLFITQEQYESLKAAAIASGFIYGQEKRPHIQRLVLAILTGEIGIACESKRLVLTPMPLASGAGDVAAGG